jgi:hypothetical protein
MDFGSDTSSSAVPSLSATHVQLFADFDFCTFFDSQSPSNTVFFKIFKNV